MAPKTIEGHFKPAENARFGIVVSRTNSLVTNQLLSGAVDCLKRHGVPEDAMEVAYVPGAFEMPVAAKKMAKTGKYNALVALGCVIRGGTPHFEYVAGEATKGLSQVAIESGIPLGFGVLTCDSLEQALERAGAKAGNKGWEAALAALETADLLDQIES